MPGRPGLSARAADSRVAAGPAFRRAPQPASAAFLGSGRLLASAALLCPPAAHPGARAPRPQLCCAIAHRICANPQALRCFLWGFWAVVTITPRDTFRGLSLRLCVASDTAVLGIRAAAASWRRLGLRAPSLSFLLRSLLPSPSCSLPPSPAHSSASRSGRRASPPLLFQRGLLTSETQ